jgi:predicted nucleic acid-binding protein
MPRVLDASLTMAWCFEDEATPAAEAVFDLVRDTGAVVPAIWPMEVSNTILVGERRGRLTEAQSTRFLQLLRGLPITLDHGAVADAWDAVLSVAREQGLSAYDGTYLELAMRRGLPLATLDTRLSDAARRVGVPLVG